MRHFFPKLCAAVELILAVGEQCFRFRNLGLKDSDLGGLDVDSGDRVAVVHRVKNVPLGNLVSHTHIHRADEARCGRCDAHIFIRTLDESASANGIRVRRLGRGTTGVDSGPLLRRRRTSMVTAMTPATAI